MMTSYVIPGRHLTGGRAGTYGADTLPPRGSLAAGSRGLWAWSAVSCAVMMVACGGSPGGGSSGANNAPVANAGPGQTVAAGTTVTLTGAGSTDPDGDPLTYSWTIAVRPPVSASILSNATSVSPTFVPDAPGTYTISLVVADNRSATSVVATTVVQVTGGNAPPVANAGPDQSVVVGQTVTLDGVQSTDTNRDALTYIWSVRKPDNSTFSPTSATAAIASFVADQAGTYVASLIVNDGTAPSTADTVTIVAGAGNVAPMANAGPHTPDGRGRARYVLVSNVPAGAVVMDGGASRDANGDAISYNWSLPSRPAFSAAVLAPVAGSPARSSFLPDVEGTYRLSLTTRDATLDSSAAAATIEARTGNVQPNAVAGSYQRVVAGTSITLDGRGSNDANGEAVQYSWSLVSKPAGSTAALSSPVAPQPTFVADLKGVYVASLIVNDGRLSSIPDATAVLALGPYDGSWTGVTNQQGTVSFAINDGQISSISFSWRPTVGVCVPTVTTVTTTYTFVPSRLVEGGSFAITETTGDVRAISATFTGQRQANGNLSLVYTSSTGCVEAVPVTFTANRP
jgi:hypothetical protein